MIERGPARECDMVLAFLRAEVTSPRFAEQYLLPIFEKNNLSKTELIDEADLKNSQQNAIRRAILRAYRGFGANDLLFKDFPLNVEWRFVEIEKGDYGRLKFANEPTWSTLTEGTRSVKMLADKIRAEQVPENPAEHVRAIQKRLLAGDVFAPIVAVEGNHEALVLLEGHSRATAYVGLEWNPGILTILGSSPEMSKWFWF
jgi:hypothetical protein